jgi:hypothetical protein
MVPEGSASNLWPGTYYLKEINAESVPSYERLQL